MWGDATMKITEKIKTFKEEHPTATKIIIGTTGAVVAVTVICVACGTCGIKVEVTTVYDRVNRVKELGYAQELKNAALGIEAKHLDPSLTWDKHKEICSKYL